MLLLGRVIGDVTIPDRCAHWSGTVPPPSRHISYFDTVVDWWELMLKLVNLLD